VTELHVLAPDTVHDPASPSGGNTYDRCVCAGLAALGWSVRWLPVAGEWPTPTPRALERIAEALSGLPDDATVLCDGLVACAAPEALLPQTDRLRTIVLVHLPLGDQAVDVSGLDDAGFREAAVLCAAWRVVVTSEWTRRRLLELYPIDPTAVHVAQPGVQPAPLAWGSPSGSRLLCVAAVSHLKGQDRLLGALAQLVDLAWDCVCAGSLEREPELVRRLLRQAEQDGIADRVHFVGPLGGEDLERAYAAADLLVLPSRTESYGMVVTEALARGLPVVATAVGGVAEALGGAGRDTAPGLLVPPGDTDALAEALGLWLRDPGLRDRLRSAAVVRRASLSDWSETARRVDRALTGEPA
jgi:glycosyltransferase involved in cell wall biosynthesis